MASSISISSSSSFIYDCNKLTTSYSRAATTTTTSRVRFIRASSSSKPLIIPSTPYKKITKVVPAIIVGGGKLGKALEGMGNDNDLLVKRGESVPVDFNGPIFVCTRHDDLDAVLQVTPQSRWKDLVFFQKGMLEPWLQSKGLNNADQVLADFTVSKLGEPPIDVLFELEPFPKKRKPNPEGLTAAYGKWASAVATRLQAGGLFCKVLENEAFQMQLLEKLIWTCAYMLVGARYPGATVRCVYTKHIVEVSFLITELASAATAEKRVVFEQGLQRRLFAYSEAVPHFPCVVKEFKWTNGWFYSLSQKAIDEGKPDPCPTHTTWLKELKLV